MENKAIKRVVSSTYNYIFNTTNGNFSRWGKDINDNPLYSPFGPEILDIEVSTICNGPIGRSPCSWCYKSNIATGKNMSFGTFKKIFSKIPRNLTQIAFGIGDLNANPDLIYMFEYCRENIVVPNITINGYGLTDYYVKKLTSLCGAVNVSKYQPKNICYDAVKRLTDNGLKQCSIHALLSEETYEQCLELIEDSLTDKRLEKLNAIIFLMLKKKGKRNSYNYISYKKFESLINKRLDNIGIDSCGVPTILNVIKNNNNSFLDTALNILDPCEAGLFSLYIDVNGNAYPCSFMEGRNKWENGLSVLNCENFLDNIWFNSKLNKWRKKLINSSQDCTCSLKNVCRSCIEYPVDLCKGENNEM